MASPWKAALFAAGLVCSGGGCKPLTNEAESTLAGRWDGSLVMASRAR